jgi:CRISPR/Cas system-associated exonuclease Cas4 (RecB family)
MFIEKVMDHKERHIEQWPITTNRASECGHPCDRYLVFNRTRLQERALHPVSLQLVFDLGNDIERRVLRDLEDAGITIKEQQRAFSWPDYQITGSIDAKIIDDGYIYPLEIKSCSPFVFERLKSIEDLKRGKYLYLRKYPTQLNLYLLMSEQEKGLFIFKNKVNGQMKEIWMDLDYELGESTLQKLERVNTHVANKTLPDPIEYDEMTCSDCGYNHICVPDRIGKEIEMIDDEELTGLLADWERLKPFSKEYDEIDKRISEIVNGREKLLVGDFFITGSWRKRTGYNVPDDVKRQYAQESQYWVKKIQKVA